MSKGFPSRWPDIVLPVVIFALALSVRFVYQRESVIIAPIRADAHRYFSAAYNLALNGEYSIASPFGATVEESAYILPPGYPLFLRPFITATGSIGQFLAAVGAVQAILGSLTAVMVYALSRFCLPPAWAFPAGLLIALSPHLVAADHFLLSESLFTFTITLGLLALLLSWRNGRPLISLCAGLLFGYAFLVRPFALLLGPFIGTAYLLRPRTRSLAPGPLIGFHLFFFLAGWIMVYVPYGTFQDRLRSGSPPPPSRMMLHLYYGTDVNLEHFMDVKKELASTEAREQLFSDRRVFMAKLRRRFETAPWSFLKWYGGGKALFMWRWDNFYNGDVYQYPMKRKGFEVHHLLRGIHRLMKAVHWPLFALTLLAPLFFLHSWMSGTIKPGTIVIAAPILAFIYFAALLTALVPLPRYAIPARPVASILGLYSLREITGAASNWLRRKRQPPGVRDRAKL